MDRSIEAAEAAAAVRAAFQARRAGTGLDTLVDVGADEALAMQLEVARCFAQEEGDPIGGWKVGMTSGSARDAMGAGFRPFGYVLGSRIFRSGATVPFQPQVPGAIEPEICLVLGEPLRGSEVTPDRARAAVRAVAPAFELLASRMTATGPGTRGTKLIDGLSNWGLVLGDEVPVDRLAEHTSVELHRDGSHLETAVSGETVEVDDVFTSLVRLCQRLDAVGAGLEAGQPVLTGAFIKTPASAPSTWLARFADIGEVSVTLV
jgi:2-keto-4-pentenoate hydratase